MESKIDWLTLTIKPENPNITFGDCFHLLGDKMLLTDLFAKMVPVGRFAFFDWTIAYENISLSCPKPEKFSEQGICLRISSQGLDYLTRYLKTYNIEFKQWLGEWRALSFQGYISKETRIDYAMDDICYNDEKPTLTMKKVMDCRRKGEMCKKARVVDIFDGSTSVKERYKTVNKEPVVGRTVYVGSRESEVSCRFYDKLAEQLQKKQPLPENCTSWVRCEFEFKGSKAMSVLNAFLDYDKVDFEKYMRGVINNYCSFIVRNNKNISRCPIKRWWAKFLGGCLDKFKLPYKKPERSALARADRGLSEYVPTIYTMYCEMGVVGVYKYFKKKIDDWKAKNPCFDNLYKVELARNIQDNVLDYEEMDGVKYHQYASFDTVDYFLDNLKRDDPEYFRARKDKDEYAKQQRQRFMDKLKRDHNEYFLARKYVLHYMDDYEKKRHQDFMDGYEVLY